MSRLSQHDILFEPLKIGPVTAPNRFYQVPHCSGMPHLVPHSNARMRAIKAEGGWGVVSTEACSIHPTSEAGPTPEDKLWDDSDIPYLSLLVDGVHEHGSLAAAEILHHGAAVANRMSREIPISPRGGRLLRHRDPVQARTMDGADIRAFRRWHKDAALRAKQSGFDIIYVYAGHEVSLPLQFIWRRYNDRTDEYGGSLENRTRLLRELLEDTRDAVGDKCAIACRLTVEELLGEEGITAGAEGREILEMLSELPDLWDVTVSDWSNDSTTARFAEEGWQSEYVGFVKSVTTKPVVGTGRFTSPDLMASLIRKGSLDMIGAARPSIADPFLPEKIRDGRYEDIRECIGCNMCVTGNNTAVPIRCTQNPTMGEEWRRNWHPEKIDPANSEESILIVGGGPAGLEAAHALGKRGYHTMLAEASTELGGRLKWESRLPGLATWIRVRDYRMSQFTRLPNVETYLDSELGIEEILSFKIPHVVLATGAKWRSDGVGQALRNPVDGWQDAPVLTPDKVAEGAANEGPVLIYDDDCFYLGSSIAEKLARDGHVVRLVTPAAEAAAWTIMTLEQKKIQTRLMKLGVEILPHKTLQALAPDHAVIRCLFTDELHEVEAANVVLLTERIPDTRIYDGLERRRKEHEAGEIRPLTRIGDCWAPATIAHAVFHGHRFAREFQEKAVCKITPRRELVAL